MRLRAWAYSAANACRQENSTEASNWACCTGVLAAGMFYLDPAFQTFERARSYPRAALLAWPLSALSRSVKGVSDAIAPNFSDHQRPRPSPQTHNAS